MIGIYKRTTSPPSTAECFLDLRNWQFCKCAQCLSLVWRCSLVIPWTQKNALQQDHTNRQWIVLQPRESQRIVRPCLMWQLWVVISISAIHHRDMYNNKIGFLMNETFFGLGSLTILYVLKIPITFAKKNTQRFRQRFVGQHYFSSNDRNIHRTRQFENFVMISHFFTSLGKTVTCVQYSFQQQNFIDRTRSVFWTGATGIAVRASPLASLLVC